jgi:hypothetical protein
VGDVRERAPLQAHLVDQEPERRDELLAGRGGRVAQPRR